jgi:hypothetical protein
MNKKLQFPSFKNINLLLRYCHASLSHKQVNIYFIKWRGKVLKKLFLALLSVLTLFVTVAFAQEPACFVGSKGQSIGLSNACANSNSTGKLLSFPDVQIESADDGTSLEVKGTVANYSNQAVPLLMVNFNVMDKKQGSILTSDNAVVLSGGVIQPGEELAFSKLISTLTLGEKVNKSKLRVQVTGSV